MLFISLIYLRESIKSLFGQRKYLVYQSLPTKQSQIIKHQPFFPKFLSQSTQDLQL